MFLLTIPFSKERKQSKKGKQIAKVSSRLFWFKDSAAREHFGSLYERRKGQKESFQNSSTSLRFVQQFLIEDLVYKDSTVV